MPEFDENLIPYHQIFQNEFLFEIYQNCKKFNNHLPQYWKQLDLFTYRVRDMQLLLGLDKINLNNEFNEFRFEYYFLTKRYIDGIDIVFELTSYPGFVTNETRKIDNKEYIIASPPFSIISSIRVNALNKEAIKEHDYTLNSFLNGFSLSSLKTSLFSPI